MIFSWFIQKLFRGDSVRLWKSDRSTVSTKRKYTLLSSCVLKTEGGQMKSTFPLAPLNIEYMALSQVYTFFWWRLYKTFDVIPKIILCYLMQIHFLLISIPEVLIRVNLLLTRFNLPYCLAQSDFFPIIRPAVEMCLDESGFYQTYIITNQSKLC